MKYYNFSENDEKKVNGLKELGKFVYASKIGSDYIVVYKK